MVDILHSVGIAAAPDKVFAALTTVEGIRGWWSSDAHGAAGEGEAFMFRTHQFEVLEAKAGQIRWRYSGSAKQWLGTEIDFQLYWREIQTMVRFTHRDWQAPTDFMRHCSTKWATFLLSLKDHVEADAGRPEPRDAKIEVNG